MYLNPNPNPNKSGAAPCTNSDTSTETVRFTPALPDVLFPSLSPMWTEFGTAVGSVARDNKHRHTPGDPNLRVGAVYCLSVMCIYGYVELLPPANAQANRNPST